ncbi:MAG: hypothetical protein AAB691_00910 [Patescibacteria group bacterium]
MSQRTTTLLITIGVAIVVFISLLFSISNGIFSGNDSLRRTASDRSEATINANSQVEADAPLPYTSGFSQ